MITSAFTCTGPYAILIMLGIKRVENRCALPVPSKGRCAISCNKTFSKEEYGNFVQRASRELSAEEFEMIPSWSEVKDWPGKIIGCCNYEAVEFNDDCGRRWDEGYKYWWKLSETVCFDVPIPCRGNVGMWEMPRELAVQVTYTDKMIQSVGARIAMVEDAVKLFRLAVAIANGSEGFFVLPLDENRYVLAEPILVSLGVSSTTTTVSPSDVFGAALKVNAKSIIVAHNHPSGNTTPSMQDRELTATLKRLGSDLGITVLDHVIVGGDSFSVI